MRPRSSLAPIAEIPPKARRMLGICRAGRGGPGSMAGSVTTPGGVSTGSIVTSLIVAPSRRFHGFAVRGRHLQEQLLEIARGPGEADHGDAGADRLGEHPRRRGIVASESQLDGAIREDR